jgi:hypothetical protein
MLPLSRVSSRRDCASSPQSTPRVPSLEDATVLQVPSDDSGKGKGLSSRSLTFVQLWHSFFLPAAGLSRVGSLGSFPAPSPPASSPTPLAGSSGGEGGSSLGGAGSAVSWGWCSALCLPLCTRLPCALAVLVFLVTLVSWDLAPGRRAVDPRLPTHIPALLIPTSPGRGPSLLATLHSLESRVDTLLLCNSAPQVPELQCLLQEVTLLAQAGELNIGSVRIVTPSGAPGPVYGVAECWNAMVDSAFQEAAVPWLLVMNDDVGMPQGALGAAVEETWRTHQGHSLLLAQEGLPGVGYAFSAFVLTRAGRAALGSFDENFFPAYYEVRPCAAPPFFLPRTPSALTLFPPPAPPSPPQDCDYFRRAQLLGMPWRRLPQLLILHPIHKYLPSLPELGERVAACVARASPEESRQAVIVQGAVGTMLRRARSATAWRDFAHSDRHYYQKKWGGGLNRCGEGSFPTPFNDPLKTLAFWAPDAAMRRATLQGTALEQA